MNLALCFPLLALVGNQEDSPAPQTPKLPSFAYSLKIDLWEEHVDRREYDSPLLKELQGGYPKLTTKHLISTNRNLPDPGRDVACGDVLSEALINKAVRKSEDAGSGRVKYYFRVVETDFKVFTVDSLNRVVSWAMYPYNDNEGKLFKTIYRSTLRLLGDPVAGGRKEERVNALWTWSKGPGLLVSFRADEDGTWTTSIRYAVE